MPKPSPIRRISRHRFWHRGPSRARTKPKHRFVSRHRPCSRYVAGGLARLYSIMDCHARMRPPAMPKIIPAIHPAARSRLWRSRLCSCFRRRALAALSPRVSTIGVPRPGRRLLEMAILLAAGLSAVSCPMCGRASLIDFRTNRPRRPSHRHDVQVYARYRHIRTPGGGSHFGQRPSARQRMAY